MSQGGRICRKLGRGGGEDADHVEVEDAGDTIRLLVHGRVIRTLTGVEAEDVRAVLDDPAALERIITRLARR